MTHLNGSMASAGSNGANEKGRSGNCDQGAKKNLTMRIIAQEKKGVNTMYTDFDAQDKMAALTESIRLVERIRDEIAGMGFRGIEYTLTDLMSEIDDERRDIDEQVREENEAERQAEEREYYASCY